ncbi:saxitoxin and tetrodotoxin-binding protein 1 [Chanos chanos]|uniref:Saxitoxin and tetrodotoxin-binding protein 1 n=1 Tax=Chanos chanos TaxID=29144 RepID=A0A6J2VTJ2_CHACN|nr:saxitoxin and tetrodotoxin-binding protein 1-like [Chanos chanos]
MRTQIAIALLGLLAFTDAAPLDCEELVKPIAYHDDYTSIMGKWIFTQGFSDGQLFTTILEKVNSSWMAFEPSPVPDTFPLSQGNMIGGLCEFTSTNTTVINGTFLASEKNVTSTGIFLPSCSDCLTMSFKSDAAGQTINSLYLFVREGKDATFDTFQKQAECLGYKGAPSFTYNGVTELCKIKDSTSDSKSSEGQHHH